MDSTFGRPSHLFLRILLVLVFIVPSTLAQQPQPQPPAPAPTESQADKNKDGKEGQDKKTADDQVGKSKLEKETGTVNDRIFEVLPNYGTVETSKTFHRSPLGRNFGWPPRESSTGPHFRSTGR